MATIKSVALALLALLFQHNPNDFKDSVQTISKLRLLDRYDFIIVGAGSAGSSLANRLSEVEEWKVLLIEAGDQESALSKTPAMHVTLPKTRYDWNYTTTQQKRTCKATEGKCNYERGRALGGSSSTNAMIYTRGYKSDYDKWGRDNCGWNFADVEPYFKQLEGNTIPGLIHYGRRGPLTVGYPPYASPIRDDIIKAGQLKGMRNADCPKYEHNCIYATRMTIRDGRRCSASMAYLEPITTKRDNLHVITNVYVSKVIIEDHKAKGVELMNNGETLIVRADKEVVLSAGSINSPKILMLSGIGSKNHLKQLEIKTIVDLPVGDNLQDHNNVAIHFQVKNGSIANLDTLANPNIQNQYVKQRKGPFSYTGFDVMGFLKTSTKNKQKPPNVQYHFNTFSTFELPFVEIRTSVVRPKSRGTLRLNSSNPLDDPLIDVNYYNDHRDWKLTLEGMKFAYKLFQTSPLYSYNLTLINTIQPLCADKDIEIFFNCTIEYYTKTLYHPVGTVKMAPREKNGVVNNKLQVYGVDGLRVIDASIPPTTISMNTNAMAVMIGEKGADLIKATYGKSTLQKIKPCQK